MNKSNIIIENVSIIDIGSEGNAIAKVNNQVIFVPQVIPGDIVDIRVKKRRKNFIEGVVVNFKHYSDKRVSPFCTHFGVCGGCKWQNLPYEDQLKYKEKQVTDNLIRIGKLDIPEVNPILASENTIYYRNKLEFTFSNKRYLINKDDLIAKEEKEMNGVGLHIKGLFDKVLDIDECFLQAEPSNKIRNAIREFALQNNYSFFDLRNKQGLLRTMIFRNTSINELMLILVFYHNDQEKIKLLLDFISSKFPEINSLCYIINSKANDTILDQDVICYKGKDHIIEEMEGLKFKIRPKSFFQTNSKQTLKLYKIAREFAEITSNDIVYDLYTGTGTIANFIAQQAKKVIGIEYVEDAIKDAKENSEFNGITNTLFFAGDMKDILTSDFINIHGKPDVIITDPPRAGMHTNVINAIINATPNRIVYVSCNPATQARDLSLLANYYDVKKVQPVDMFPHTHHVENVVLLKLKQ